MQACEKYEDLLQQYLDKALDSAQTAVLMSHLEICGQCRRDFKLYQKVVEGLEHLEELAPPGRLTSEVMAQLEGMPNGNPVGNFVDVRQPAPWLWGLSSAAAAAAAIAAVFLFRAGSPESLPRPEMQATLTQPATITVPASPLEEPAQVGRPVGPRILLTVSAGAVQVQKANSSRWEAIPSATEVGYGDKIRTLIGASAHIEYTQDKTTLKLRPSSLVQILANSVRVYHGDTWIRVDKVGSHFQAETPNAVASVRGTRFSAEVRYPEKLAKLYDGDLEESKVVHRFMDQYKKNLADERLNGLMPMMAYPMHATPVSLAVQVNMLLDAANFAREAKTNVQVFQSKVNVASIDPVSGKETASVLVKEGHQTNVANMQLAKLTPMKEDDFVRWGLPPNQALLDTARAEATAAAVEPAATLSPGAAAQHPTAADGPAMMIEAGDRSNPGYDGVERRSK